MSIAVLSETKAYEGASARAAMRWALVGFAALALCYSAFTPDRPLPSLFPQQDKLEHLAAFAALSVLILWRTSTSSLWPAALILGGFGVEAVQSGLGYREASIQDALASNLGVICGWALSAAGATAIDGWRSQRSR